MDKNYNKINILENINIKTSKTKNYLNKNKLFIGYNLHRRKNSAGTLSDNLNFSSDCINSNINSSSYESNFRFSKYKNSIIDKPKNNEELGLGINIIKDFDEEKNTFQNINNKISYVKTIKLDTNININNNNDFFSFKCDNQSNKNSTLIPGKLKLTKSYKNSTYIKSSEISKGYDSSKKQSQKTFNGESIINNKTIKVYSNKSDKSINTSSKDFLTLEDVSINFSKKIKKKIKRRKKIQKLKELLKLQKFKIDKNLLELYYNNTLRKKNVNENILNKENNLNNSATSNNNKSSKIFSSTNSDESSSTIIKSSSKFNIKTFEIITSESFEIKSSYKNINILSNEKMVKNKKYKKFIENLIKKYTNEFIFHKDNYKSFISSLSPKYQKDKIKIVTVKKYQTQKEQNNPALSDDKINSNSKRNNTKNFYDEKQFLSKNENSDKLENNLMFKNSKLNIKHTSKYDNTDNNNNEQLARFKTNGIILSKPNNIIINSTFNILNQKNLSANKLFKLNYLDETENERGKNELNNNIINDAGNNKHFK